MAKKEAGESGSLLEKLVGWMPDFLREKFDKLSRRAQAFVYFAVLGLLAFVVVVLVFQFIGTDEPAEIMVRGRLTLDNLGEISDRQIMFDLAGDNLYVFKRPSPAGGKFTYEWILRVDPKVMQTPVTFGISGIDPMSQRRMSVCEARFTPQELIKKGYEGKTYLEIEEDFTAIRLEEHPVKSISRVSSLGRFVDFLFPRAYAFQQTSMAKRDSFSNLIGRYKQALNPVEQTSIRAEFNKNNPLLAVQLAESLKSAVAEKRSSDISTYALLLSDSWQLGQFTSAGSRRPVFDTGFYKEVIGLLRTGTDYEARNLAAFLRKLQDSRTVKLIVDEYRQTDSQVARKLYLSVLEGFTTNSDPKVRAWVGSEIADLKELQSQPRIPTLSVRELLGIVQPRAKAVPNTSIKSETPLYNFSLWLEMPDARKSEVASVEYEFNHPTFRQKTQKSTNAKDGFRVAYLGWGCLRSVIVRIYTKDGKEARMDFDMCEAVGF